MSLSKIHFVSVGVFGSLLSLWAVSISATAASAQQTRPAATIRSVNGIPRLFYNNEPVPMLAYRDRIHDDFAYMKQFADSGVRLFFMTHLVDWNKSWDEHFVEVRRRLDAILDFNDQTICVLGMFVGTSPEWAKDNPDELLWQDGKPKGPMAGTHTAMYSLASRKFEAQGVEMVRRHVEFLKTYPRRDRVIGLFFEGGCAQEWFDFASAKKFHQHPDTGPAMLRAYREYAKALYKTDHALAKAYGREGLTFDTLEIPDPELAMTPDVGDFFDPHKGPSQALIDFWRTQAKETADRMLAMGKAAKELDPNLLCGAFHEPLMDDGKNSYEFERVCSSPYLDFFAGPPAYNMRQLKDHLPIHTIVDSVAARNKLFFVEEDLRPYGISQKQFKQPHSEQVVQDTIKTYQRDLLQDAAEGTMAWIWDFQSQWFGHEQKYFEAFRQLQQIGMLNIQAKVKSVSQVAVLVDEDSKYFYRGDNRLDRALTHQEFLAEMGRTGTPYDVWLHQDVGREDFPLERYKLIIVLDAYRLNDASRKILERLKGGKRTILWAHASGFINDDREQALSVKNMTELTGFNFGRYDQRLATTVIVPNTHNRLTSLLPTGYIFGQFYRMVENGKLFPPVTRVSPIFAVEDKDAVTAGWYSIENMHPPAETSTGEVTPLNQWGNAYYVGLAYKEFADWTSVYAGAVALPAEFLRAMAKFAGVHVYLDSDDILYANSHMVVMHTGEQAGPRTIHLPSPSKAFDLLNGVKPVSDKAVAEFTIDAKPVQTYAWWLSEEPPTLPAMPQPAQTK